MNVGIAFIILYFFVIPGDVQTKVCISWREQWTDNRNCHKIETVKSLVQVKFNYSLTCSEMYDYLLKNDNLLRQIQSSNKYVHWSENEILMVLHGIGLVTLVLT